MFHESSIKKLVIYFVIYMVSISKTVLSERYYSSHDDRQNFTNLSIQSFGKFHYTNLIADNYVWKIFPILLLVIGTVSNILSIIIFLSREMRKYSSFVYFAVLNIVNLVLIYVTYVRMVMDTYFGRDIRTINMYTCKIHLFLTYFLGHLSSLLLSMISIDRVISVIFLHKSKILCTPKIAISVTLVLTVFNFFMSSHFLFMESAYWVISENDTSNNKLLCDPKIDTNYRVFIFNVWKIIDMSFYAFIPFIIMSICSIIIIIRVAENSKKFQKKSDAKKIKKKPDVQNDQTINIQLLDNISSATQNKLYEANEFPKPITLKVNNDFTKCNRSNENNCNFNYRFKKQNQKFKFSNRTRNLALMLIPVNILFLVFLAPVVITLYLYKDLEDDKLTLAIVELLATCNYTFNFIIYFLTSSKFREECKKLFKLIFGKFLK